MYFRPFHSAAGLAFVCAALFSGAPVAAQDPDRRPPAASPAPANELDAFMAKVLARREVNRKTMDQYVLDETESFEILGPGRSPLYRTKREYTWYVRDGMHVRSPLKFNGVAIGEEARQRYEANWVRRERARQERKAKGEKESGEIVIGPDGVQVSGTPIMPTEPRFVSEAYFMDFKFEAGNYYLAGREQLEGQEVLKVEYYPTGMFGDSDEERRRNQAKAAAKPEPKRTPEQERNRRREQEFEQDIERKMNKTALITLWIDPAEHQIVKYTFDNVWLDFLPAAWLVRVDDLRASMTMGQPFPGVWLPRRINIHAGVTLANGSFEAGYERAFMEYRLAEVATKMRVPKRSARRPAAIPVASLAAAVLPTYRGDADDADAGAGSGPFVPETFEQAAQETIGEIRVHGNAFVTDKEVLDIAGVAVGQPLAADGVDGITRRLSNSRLFETVEVRKRYRSLTSTTDIALVLLVHEKPGIRSSVPVPVPGMPDRIVRPVGRLRSKLMFLPILSFADGYGFTYGGRASTVDLLGMNERLSVPLTWGGTRRAALEFERNFKTGPLTRVDSSFGISNRENPRFEIRDQRVELRGRAERVFGDVVRAGLEASRASINFGTLDDRLWTIGSAVTLDTRLDPAFPGNAILVSTGWTGLNFRSLAGRVNRYDTDARGYLRIFRQIVVAGRARYTTADAALPPYERLLLGGSSSVRGFRTGSFDGDRTFVTSGEMRVPITSVLSGAKLGVTAFVDAGKVWNVGESMESAAWHRGVGGGIFMIASVVRINLDVARGLKTGDTRLHLSSGFTF